MEGSNNKQDRQTSKDGEIPREKETPQDGELSQEKEEGRDRPQNGINGQRTISPWSCIAWIIVISLILFFPYSMFTKETRVRIPYSEFKKQLNDGNIIEITMTGQEIEGKFKKEHKIEIEATKKAINYSLFSTLKPSIEDPDLIKLLEEKGVVINVEKAENFRFIDVLITFLPWLLLALYFIYIFNRAQGSIRSMGGGDFLGFRSSRVKRFIKTKSTVTYDSVAGLENAKKDMQEVVEFLKEPAAFIKMGAKIPRGILLIGPPGTGKTLLARATAGEANVPFFSISGSEFIEMFVGVGAARVRDLFETAKKEAPSIIFVDELDSVGKLRGTGIGGGHDEQEQTLNQILSEMDGFTPNESVIVLSATNRPDVLDPALLRPGRFDRQIVLDLPQKQAREKILRIHTQGVPLNDDVDLTRIAAMTVGFSGADLKNLVNEAALLAVRKKVDRVSASDFGQARDKVLLGNRRDEMMSDRDKRLVAYHEAGHALMALMTPGADPLQKVTIIPRGRSLGATEQIPEEDHHNFNRQYLMNRIAITLGGRAAEKLVFNEITNGAADDLKQVTRLARRMITQWGMSERLGPATFAVEEEHPFLGRDIVKQREFSEETLKIIDEEVQKLTSSMEEKALNTINANRYKLDLIAEQLLEHETLEGEDIEALLAEAVLTA